MITSHRNKTHTYYRKDSNKLGAKKFRLVMYNIEDMVFRNGVYIARHTPLVYIARHTPLVYIQSNEGYGK